MASKSFEKTESTEKGKDLQGQLERLVKEFSNSENPITLKMLTLEEYSKEILIELVSNPELEEKIDPLLAAIEPTDFSARRLKLELANFLRRPEIIIDYIQTEEKLLIDRALKYSWIFKAGASRLSNPKFLIEHLFPKVSYSVRTRIIHRLSKYLNDEKLSELMLKAIENKYGWSAVLPLVPACSIEFIRPIMEGNRSRCQLTETQLIRIARKDVKVVTNYLDWSYKTRHVISSHEQTLKYLVQNEPKEFIRLYDACHELGCYVPVQNGKRTKQLILADSQTILKIKAKTFSEILNKNQVMKTLKKDELKEFFALLLPESLEKFKEEITILLAWIQLYPSQEKLQIVRYAFEKVYGLKLAENMEYMTPSLVQLLVSEVEEREKIVDWKLLTKDEGRVTFDRWESLPTNRLAFWYSFYGTEKAITKIKELIATESDVNGRGELLQLLVNACWYNGRDIKALTSVCKYVATRFRNDQYQVRHAFLNTLKDTFNLNKFMNKELFVVYHELIKLMILNEEPNIYDFLQIAVLYALKNDLPVDSYFLHFIKSKISMTYTWWNSDWYNWCGSCATQQNNVNSEFQKRFLIRALKCLEEVYPLEKPLTTLENELMMTNTIVSIVDGVNQIRTTGNTAKNNTAKNNEEETISVTAFPWLLARSMEILENEYEDVSRIRLQKFLVQSLNKDPKARNLLYKDLIQSCPFPLVVNYFAWKDPVKLIANLDSVLLFILHQKNIKEYKSFFLRIKAQGFPDLSAKIVEKCLETAEDEKIDILERKNAIQILPLLWETQNCLNLISYFYPPQSKLDMSEENFEVLFEMRKAIAMSFSNLSLPVAAFQGLIKFCTGDYLKLTVNSLYSICLHSPQSDSIRFLKEELLDRPVSVKKHTIRLVSKIALKEDVPEFLSYLWSENEANVSIREAILVAIFQLLIDEPSKENWNLLKATVESLAGQDKACLSQLVQVRNISAIPPEFLSSYLSTVWNMLNLIKNEDDKVTSSLKAKLVEYLTRDIEYIPREFLDIFVSENLFNPRSGPETEVEGMACLAAEYFAMHDDPLKTISSAFDQIRNSQKSLSSVEYVRYEPAGWCNTLSNEMNAEFVIPLYFAKKATCKFITELCERSFELTKKKQRELKVKDLKIFLEKMVSKINAVLEILKKSAPDAADIFKEEFFLSLTTIFFEQNIAETSLSPSKEDKLQVDKKKHLHDIGAKLGKFFDLLVKQWSPSSVELICDNLSIFFEKCYIENLMVKTDIVFLAHGILHCDSTISLENQLIISKLLPIPSSREATCDTKYKELYNYIMNSSEKLVRASLLNRLSKYY